MIHHAASAVFLLRDAFSGETLRNGSATRCLLDGRPLRRPIWKREGYLVLADLEPGEHTLRISRSGFRDEVVPLLIEEGRTVEDTIALKPGGSYRFPKETVRVSLRLTRGRSAAAFERIWLGVPLRSQLKLAQEKTEAGDAEARLFCEGSTALLPIPGHYLLMDKKMPELAYLRLMRGESAEFSPPLAAGHTRGTELTPMQAYDADETGMVTVLLRESGTLVGFSGGKKYEAEVSTGEQRLEWKLGG